MLKTIAAAAAFAITLASPAWADAALDAQIGALAHAWDHAQFEINDHGAKAAELHRLDGQAAQLAQQNPASADPIVWRAIILSSEAGAEGGFGALHEVTEARDLLLQAEHINPNALGDGSIYTSLGSLYAQVPGFPIGFGNKDRARDYLQRAVQMNPTGIEPNYFMADYLVRVRDYPHAIEYLHRAEAAPARPGRDVADAGRRRDVAALLQRAQAGH